MFRCGWVCVGAPSGGWSPRGVACVSAWGCLVACSAGLFGVSSESRSGGPLDPAGTLFIADGLTWVSAVPVDFVRACSGPSPSPEFPVVHYLEGNSVLHAQDGPVPRDAAAHFKPLVESLVPAAGYALAGVAADTGRGAVSLINLAGISVPRARCAHRARGLEVSPRYRGVWSQQRSAGSTQPVHPRWRGAWLERVVGGAVDAR